MRRVKHLVRQAVLAALSLVPLSAVAEVSAHFDEASGDIVLRGLETDQQVQILANPDKLRLQVMGLETQRGMQVKLEGLGANLIITPRFLLLPGTDYVVRLNVEGFQDDLELSVPAPDETVPTLTSFSPSQSVIPANTLRMYVHFSEPMARGQMRDVITLLRSDGTQVENPFLTLGPELWDPSQTRVTLLLDPGQIKQGVGPNVMHGAPLASGNDYRLIVSRTMESATRVPLGKDATITFRAGHAERRAITPESWQVLQPRAGSQAPITIAFDRIMDTGALRRLLTLKDQQGRPVTGHIQTDGGGWSLTPSQAWEVGTYFLIVAPDLEDVSGNSIGAPFDARAGTIGNVEEPVVLKVNISN